MLSWMIVLMALTPAVALLAWHARRRPKAGLNGDAQPAADASAKGPSAPSLEHDGRVYFFCSVAERDICSANLRGR